MGMLHIQRSSVESGGYFWNEGRSSSSSQSNNDYYRRVPIQAWTALLKAYVHSGVMSKTDSLFDYLMTSAASKAGGGKNRKQRDENTTNRNNNPNVRTFNTLLRGCMWTAASIADCEGEKGENELASSSKDDNHNKKKKQKKNMHQSATSSPSLTLCGGVPTAQRAWSICNSGGDKNSIMVQFDTSSYEYFVTILSQALRCKDALRYLDQMKRDFGISSSNANDDIAEVIDPSIMESIIVCLVAISRGYVMLGDFDQGQKCANEALVVMDRLQLSLDSSGSVGNTNLSSASQPKKVVTGGKRAWNKSKGGGVAETDGKPDGRREESNKLFRSHRLSELRSEATTLKSACSSSNRPEECIVTYDAKSFSRLMMTRLFYFSGGGTTQATSSESNNIKKVDNSLTYQRWIHSLWHSFGLRETTQRALGNDDDLRNIFPPKKKSDCLPDLLSPELCDNLRSQLLGSDCSVLSDNGCLNFDTIFRLQDKEETHRPLHIELGSGSGDWCVTQSKLNPHENYVTVELRADRVAQTFFKCITQNTWKNMCCVGSDCGSFLRDRVSSSQCRTIFVNHPEPPTQTYDNESSDEEPAHMLNSANIRLAANCLEGQGKGRLVIVTDNLIYARFLCRTMARVMADGSLVGLHPSEVRDLRIVDSFHVGNSSLKLWLYEGKPSSSIGHFDTKKWAGKDVNEMDRGTSYFDRLWRTGAGKHADMKKRYIVVVGTSGGARVGRFNEGAAVHSFARGGKKSAQGKKSNGNGTQKQKKPKKRSAEAQKRRNERRLLKKEQAQRSEQGEG